MSAATAKYGILVGVDGSAQSNAAVAWAAREAVMRQLPITLLHIVAPVVVGWPVGQLYANMTEWQKDNAQQVIEQAREALTNSLGESKPPQVHTELVFSNVVPTLIDASQQAWLMVVGSQGMGALGRLLLGSISTALLHHARCPVAIIHSGNGATPDSDAPVLDGLHARTDGFTSLAVLCSAGGVALGFPLADPIVGLLITAAILAVLRTAARDVFRRLLDGVDPAMVDAAEQALAARPGVQAVRSVRMRWIGHRLHADAELDVDPALDLAQAHRIAHDAEHELTHTVPKLTTALIHAYPAEHGSSIPDRGRTVE